MADMKPPQRGGKPRRITTDAPPGGRHTPGARKGKPMPPKEDRQRQATQGIRARRGLAPMLAQQGADPETLEAAQLIESMPGGPELLYSYAAEQFGKKAGASKKDMKKVRLYEIGGYVEKAEGGLAKAAETTRRGGRNGDSMLVHMTPEEFEVIESMWGSAETNPDTGMPEYGFLSKIWKKVKKAVKKVFSSKIFQIVAPIALSIFAPGLGTALGGMLTGGAATGVGASMLGNAVIRGGMSAAGGGDFMTGAIQGAVSGGLGTVAGDAVKGIAPGLSDQTAAVIGSGLAGGAGAELTGGDFTQGAIMGGLGQMMQPTMESMASKGREVFGFREPLEGEILATRQYAPGDMPEGELAEIDISTLPKQRTVDIGAGDPTQTPAGTGTGTGTGTAPATGGGGGLGDLALPLALAGMSGGFGGGEYEEPGRPEIPESFEERLPIYSSERQFIGPTDPSAYYQYGMQGAPTTGESLFITPDPFAGETGTPTTGGLEAAGAPMGQGIQGLIQTGQIVPAEMAQGAQQALQQAGYTPGQDGSWYPPGQQQLGQGTGFALGGWHEQNTDVSRVIPTVSASGGFTEGPGTGRSDDIPARLSDGEYVIDAESVALLGDGSGKAGAQRLDEMRRNLRQHKAKNLRKGGFSHKAKTPTSYMPQLRAAAGRA